MISETESLYKSSETYRIELEDNLWQKSLYLIKVVCVTFTGICYKFCSVSSISVSLWMLLNIFYRMNRNYSLSRIRKLYVKSTLSKSVLMNLYISENLQVQPRWNVSWKDNHREIKINQKMKSKHRIVHLLFIMIISSSCYFWKYLSALCWKNIFAIHSSEKIIIYLQITLSYFTINILYNNVKFLALVSVSLLPCCFPGEISLAVKRLFLCCEWTVKYLSECEITVILIRHQNSLTRHILVEWIENIAFNFLES